MGTATDKFVIALFALSLAMHNLGEGKPVLASIILLTVAFNAIAFIAILARRA